MTGKNNVIIFFSWQSTLETNANAHFIRNSLRRAKKIIERKNSNISIHLDEATRDVPGSPNIAQMIQKKISLAQIVISDLTIIQGTSKKRSFPNPNVMFELGYAVAEIGWDRVIVLMNKKYGHSPENLPFDVNSQRVSPFDSDQHSKNLDRLLVVAIESIITHAPKTPQELRGVTKEKIMHEKDVKSIEQLFSYLHIPTIESFLEELPNLLIYNSFTCWESLNSMINSNSFNIYDPLIDSLLNKIYKNWKEIYDIGLSYYDDHGNGIDLIFSKSQYQNSALTRETWSKIKSDADTFKVDLKKLIERIQTEYIEVDLNETNKSAWQDILTYRPEKFMS